MKGTMMIKPTVTDYYKMFSTQCSKTLVPLHDNVTLLAEQVASLRKNLDVETALMNKHKASMQAMKEKPLEFQGSPHVDDEVRELKSFKQRALSLANEIQAAELTCNSLQTAFEKKTAELEAVTEQLKNQLTAAIRVHRSVADRNFNMLLEAAFAEQNAFLDAFRRIYEDYGQNLHISDETLIPGVMNINDVSELKFRIEQYEKQQQAIGRE